MKGLRSDHAKAETSSIMKDIFRHYMINNNQSEPHYQHQNPAKQWIQDVKQMTNFIMDHISCHTKYWVICMLFVAGLLNVLANSKGTIPKTVVTGKQTNISAYLNFHFCQEVFVEDPKVWSS